MKILIDSLRSVIIINIIIAIICISGYCKTILYVKTSILSKLIVCVFSMLVLLSCRKKVDEVNPNFIGEWSNASTFIGDAYYLTINENSSATFYKNTDKLFKGFARIEDNILTIGGIHRFKIIEVPRQHNISFSVGLFGDSVHYKWSVILKTPSFQGGDNVTFYKN